MKYKKTIILGTYKLDMNKLLCTFLTRWSNRVSSIVYVFHIILNTFTFLL